MRRRGDQQQQQYESDARQHRKRRNSDKDGGSIIGPSNGLRVISVDASHWWRLRVWGEGMQQEERQHQQRQQLMTLPEAEPVLDVEAEIMVEVVAPTSLPGNYQFPATIQGNSITFIVTVPKGGVEKGQRFAAPISRQRKTFPNIVEIPTGRWRDSWFDIFRYGVFHPTVWNSCCCLPIAIGQLVTRLRLTLRGRPRDVHSHDPPGSFRFFFRLVFTYWTFRAVMFFFIDSLDPSTSFDASKLDAIKDMEPPGVYYLCCAVNDMIWYIYFGYSVFILKNIRSYVRTKYSIPEGRTCPGSGWEDWCCSIVCPCFTAAQLLRHTTDYGQYEEEVAQCCSDTGLQFHVPAIIV